MINCQNTSKYPENGYLTPSCDHIVSYPLGWTTYLSRIMPIHNTECDSLYVSAVLRGQNGDYIVKYPHRKPRIWALDPLGWPYSELPPRVKHLFKNEYAYIQYKLYIFVSFNCFKGRVYPAKRNFFIFRHRNFIFGTHM